MSTITEVPYNPFAANGGSPNLETKTLDVIIMKAIDAYMMDVHTCLPASILSVSGNNSVTVQPMLQRKYVNGNLVNLPAIQNVPVYVPRGNNYWIKLPIAQGDLGMILFSERSLDKWLKNAGNGVPLDPMDNRKFDLSDAIFLPGLYPFSNQTPGNATDMVLHNGSAEFYLEQAGKFKITNGSVELLDELDQLAQQTGALTSQTTDIASALVAFGTGLTVGTLAANAAALVAAMTPILSQLATIASELSTIQTDIEALKG